MAYLDLETWPRRATYAFFRGYEMPFFGICVQVDVTATRARCRETGTSFSLAVWYACLKAVNATKALRYRLRRDGVWVHECVHAGVTELLDDESIGFCYFAYTEDFALFQRGVEESRAALKLGQLEPQDFRDDLIHGTILPWVSFTGITHARRVADPEAEERPDSTPKIAFGKYSEVDGQVMMPVSIEAHHALVDGLHAARFLERFAKNLAEPEAWLL